MLNVEAQVVEPNHLKVGRAFLKFNAVVAHTVEPPGIPLALKTLMLGFPDRVCG